MFDHDYAEYTRLIVDKGFPANLLFLQQYAAHRIDAWQRGALEGNAVRSEERRVGKECRL